MGLFLSNSRRLTQKFINTKHFSLGTFILDAPGLGSAISDTRQCPLTPIHISPRHAPILVSGPVPKVPGAQPGDTLSLCRGIEHRAWNKLYRHCLQTDQLWKVLSIQPTVPERSGRVTGARALLLVEPGSCACILKNRNVLRIVTLLPRHRTDRLVPTGLWRPPLLLA